MKKSWSLENGKLKKVEQRENYLTKAQAQRELDHIQEVIQRHESDLLDLKNDEQELVKWIKQL